MGCGQNFYSQKVTGTAKVFKREFVGEGFLKVTEKPVVVPCKQQIINIHKEISENMTILVDKE